MRVSGSTVGVLKDSLVKQMRIRREVGTSATGGADQVAGEICATRWLCAIPVAWRVSDDFRHEGPPAEGAALPFPCQRYMQLGPQLDGAAFHPEMVLTWK